MQNMSSFLMHPNVVIQQAAAQAQVSAVTKAGLALLKDFTSPYCTWENKRIFESKHLGEMLGPSEVN